MNHGYNNRVSDRLEDSDIIPLVLTLKELESVMGISLLPKGSPSPALAPLHEDYPLSGGGGKSFYNLSNSAKNLIRASSTVDSANGMFGRTRTSFTGSESSAGQGSISRMISIDSNNTPPPLLRASSTSSTSGIVAQVKPNLDGVTTTEAGGVMEYVDMDDLNSGKDARTTFMIRRLPRYLSSDQLESLIQSTGLLDDAYDLLYVPIFTGKAHANRGYAFINFRSGRLGALFVSIVKYSVDTALSKQLAKCDIVYAHIQGKDDMVENLTRIRTPTSPDESFGGLFYGTAQATTGLVGSSYSNNNLLPPGLKLF